MATHVCIVAACCVPCRLAVMIVVGFTAQLRYHFSWKVSEVGYHHPRDRLLRRPDNSGVHHHNSPAPPHASLAYTHAC